jgi:hypothetical protein
MGTNDFNLITSAEWSSFQTLGEAILGIVALILCARESFNLVRGHASDFQGVLVRVTISAIMLAAVPQVAATVGGWALGINASLTGHSINILEQALRNGLTSLRCDNIQWYDLVMLFSIRGVVLIFGLVVFLAFMVVKIAIIDVGWKIMFAVVCLQAPLTLPLTAIEELGGLGHYWRNFIGIALWPVMFGIIASLVTAAFPETLSDIAGRKAGFECLPPASMDSGTVTQIGSDIVGWIKFVGIVFTLLVLTWHVPQLSAMVVGGGSAGAMGISAVSSLASGAKTVVVGAATGGVGGVGGVGVAAAAGAAGAASKAAAAGVDASAASRAVAPPAAVSKA